MQDGAQFRVRGYLTPYTMFVSASPVRLFRSEPVIIWMQIQVACLKLVGLGMGVKIWPILPWLIPPLSQAWCASWSALPPPKKYSLLPFSIHCIGLPRPAQTHLFLAWSSLAASMLYVFTLGSQCKGLVLDQHNIMMEDWIALPIFLCICDFMHNLPLPLSWLHILLNNIRLPWTWYHLMIKS